MHIQHVYKPLTDQGGMLYAWFPSMYTRVDIVLCHKPEQELLSIVGLVYEELRRLEKVGSFYDPESELYQVNLSASHAPVSVSQELYDMIDICIAYHPRTLGCFDITIQSEGYDHNYFHHVRLSPEDRTLFYQKPGVCIDLSGFLKGYALEKARTILDSHGVKDALVNMGNSSVLALGNHPHGNGWKLDFAPNPALNGVHSDGKTELMLHNQCLTTSGNESAERKHIICPQNGELVEGAGYMAVLTANGAEGEIFSTALFAATRQRRQAIIEENHLNVLNK